MVKAPAPNTATASAVQSAVSDAVNSVAAEIAYIRELADVVAESEGQGQNRVEAIGRSIALLADSVWQELERHLDAAHKEANHE
jgi:hypothetical protein